MSLLPATQEARGLACVQLKCQNTFNQQCLLQSLHAHACTILFIMCVLQVTPPFERLHEQATESPMQWAPVLAMLVHNHRYHIPYTAYTGWLQALHTYSFEDVSEPAATLWLLRYLNELAVAWPAALTAAEIGPDAAVADISTRQLESHWKVQTPPPLPPAPQTLCSVQSTTMLAQLLPNGIRITAQDGACHATGCHGKSITAFVCLLPMCCICDVARAFEQY